MRRIEHEIVEVETTSREDSYRLLLWRAPPAADRAPVAAAPLLRVPLPPPAREAVEEAAAESMGRGRRCRHRGATAFVRTFLVWLFGSMERGREREGEDLSGGKTICRSIARSITLKKREREKEGTCS